VKAIGITNQRETTVAWNKMTGQPLYNAIVWHDARTKQVVDEIIRNNPERGQDVIKDDCGLPVSTYFSASKVNLYKSLLVLDNY
jgi:glycerol kinase